MFDLTRLIFLDGKILTSSKSGRHGRAFSWGNNSDIPDRRSWLDRESMPSNCYQIASHFRDLGVKFVASSLRGTVHLESKLWHHNSKLRKCHNLSIICLSIGQLSPNLLHKRGFVSSITMQTEVSWTMIALQQTMCKQFEVSRFENLFQKEGGDYFMSAARKLGYGSMTRASPPPQATENFCCKHIFTFNRNKCSGLANTKWQLN